MAAVVFRPMEKKKSLQESITDWEKEHEEEGKKLCDEEWVDLIFRGIADLDSNGLNYIKGCKKLSLSSNFISKIPDLHFDNLEILSLGRNKIRAVRGLDFLGKSLKELWISYNEIEKLDGFKSLAKLQKLYIGNNLIAKIDELNNLTSLTELKDVVFKGNPFALENPTLYDSKPQDKNPDEIYPEIQKRIPSVEIIDGNTV